MNKEPTHFQIRIDYQWIHKYGRYRDTSRSNCGADRENIRLVVEEMIDTIYKRYSDDCTVRIFNIHVTPIYESAMYSLDEFRKEYRKVQDG